MVSTQNDRKRLELRFKLFFAGSAVLLLGLSGLTYAEFYMDSTLEQEVLGVTSLFVAAFGALGCIIGYIAILWHRLKGFFSGERK